MKKILPLGNRVVLKVIKREAQAGKILLPDAASMGETQLYEVIEKGEGRLKEDGTFRKIPLDKGDIVFIHRYAGPEMKLEGETYFVVNYEDILGAIYEDATSQIEE